MSALGDVIVEALKDLLEVLFGPIRNVIQNQGVEVLHALIGTPYPNATFSRPTNGPWPAIYDYYWEMIVPLSLLLWALAIGLVIFLESTSHLFGSYHRSKLKKRTVSGLLGILSWWWIGALSLRFVDALADTVAPDLTNIALFETLSFSAMGLLGVVVTLSTDFILFFLIGLIYFTRHVVLYLFVLLMPLLIALWIPGVGPFRLSSQFMQRLSGFYVPFLFMTIPVALLFQVGTLLGHSLGFSVSGIGAWIAALVIPFLAVVAPIVLLWQAGELYSVAGRMSRRISGQKARTRTDAMYDRTATGVTQSRDFTRGLRGRDAISSGAETYQTGSSGANRRGRRIRTGVTNAKKRLTNPFETEDSEEEPTREDTFQNLRGERLPRPESRPEQRADSRRVDSPRESTDSDEN